MTLRSKLIRLAHTNPEIRPHLLPLLTKEARLRKGPGGLLFDYGRGFSVREDHPMVYDAYILMDNGPKRPYRAALQAARMWERDIMAMRNLHEVRKFIDQKTYEAVGKYPKWHFYSMPD